MLKANDLINTKSNGQLRVVKYNNAKSVDVEFLETGYRTTAQAQAVEQGAVKDKLMPTVKGVGFIGDGGYSSFSKAYQTWKNIIARCYSEREQERFPTYKGCSVVIEWHNFQNFAKWFESNHKEGTEVDKDIKIEGNKIYSPETCIFVSHKENIIKARAKKYIVTAPLGEKVEVALRKLTIGSICP